MKGLLYFLAGLAIGAGASYLYCKSVYERQIEEDRDSIKESFKNLYENHGDIFHDEEKKEESKSFDPSNETVEQKEAIFARRKEDIRDYTKKITELGYATISDEDLETEKESYRPPYIISDEDFGEESYQTIGITYYSDGILADDHDDVMEDVANTVGQGALDYLNNSSETAVYVRNERLGVDYEVLYDHRKYSDIYSIKSHQEED